MQTEDKARDNSKIAPAPFQGPEQIGVLILVCGHNAAIGLPIDRGAGSIEQQGIGKCRAQVHDAIPINVFVSRCAAFAAAGAVHDGIGWFDQRSQHRDRFRRAEIADVAAMSARQRAGGDIEVAMGGHFRNRFAQIAMSTNQQVHGRRLAVELQKANRHRRGFPQVICSDRNILDALRG